MITKTNLGGSDNIGPLQLLYALGTFHFCEVNLNFRRKLSCPRKMRNWWDIKTIINYHIVLLLLIVHVINHWYSRHSSPLIM